MSCDQSPEISDHPRVGRVPPEADHVIVSLNPKAGRRAPGARARRLVEILEARGYCVELMTDLDRVAAQSNALYAERKLRALVGVGGDGTAAELVNRTEPGLPVTLLRSGTANLLSKYLRLGARPERMAEIIAGGHTLQLDAGRANGRLFLVMISCGFDATVVQQVHTARMANPSGGHIGYLSYTRPIWSTVVGYPYHELTVECRDGTPTPLPTEHGPETSLSARWAFLFNLPCYGWGLPLTPKAVGTDGVLDLCTFSGRSLISALRYVVGAHFGGLHARYRDCQMRRGRSFRVTSDEPIPYQLDGDPGGVLPVDVEVVTGRFTVVVPPETASRRGAPVPG